MIPATLLVVLLIISSVPVITLAQEYAIPSGWREPTSDRSFDKRTSLAQAVIDSLVPLFNASTGQIDGMQALGFTQSSNLLCAIALHDLISGTKMNKNMVANALQIVLQAQPGYYTLLYRLNSDAVNWALAAIYAYRAYGDNFLLDIAASIWEQTNSYAITSTTGTHPMRSTSFYSKCNNASTVGGVFYMADNRNNTDVNGATVGGFMTLSAYLYEATKDNKYAEAAEASAGFIRSQLYNGTIILDTITLASCDVTAFSVTYNSGFYIEGLSVWANISNQHAWTAFLNQLIASTVPFTAWTGSDGIIVEGDGQPSEAFTNGFGKALKSIFIRGLYEAWTRAPANSSITNFIESYLLVQYNALLDLATTPGSNIYSPRWHGPPVDQLLPWGQLAALDTLNSAIGLVAAQPQSPSTTATEASGAGVSHKKANISLIVGITIGTVVLVVIIILVFFILWRKRFQHQRELGEAALDALIKPFNQHRQAATSQLPAVTGSSAPSNPSTVHLLPLSMSPNYTNVPSKKRHRGKARTHKRTDGRLQVEQPQNADVDDIYFHAPPSINPPSSTAPTEDPRTILKRLNRAVAKLQSRGAGKVPDQGVPGYGASR